MKNSISQNQFKLLLESAIRDFQQEWEESINFSQDELIDIFGKEEIIELCKDKIIELIPEFLLHHRLFRKKLNYLKLRKFNEIEEYIIQKALESEHWDRVLGIKKQLQMFSALYLKLRGMLYKNKKNLSEEEIQQTREYKTHELYDGKKIKSGTRFLALCPFHKERTASFFFYEDGSFHCFGCHVHGRNAIDYLMKLKNYTFVEAVQQLL